MRGVDVCVRFMPARRTPEDMPLADSQKPAPGAGPACVGRINLGYGQPAQLRLVLDGDTDFPPLPGRLLPMAEARGSRRRVITVDVTSCWHSDKLLLLTSHKNIEK